MEWAREWRRQSPTAKPWRHHYPVSHTQMQAPHQQMQQTFTARVFTAAVTAFTAALLIDIHSAACTSSAADPQTCSIAEHAATATLPADASAAGNSTTAFHTVTAASTAAAATDNTKTSVNTAAASAAAVYTAIQSANITEHHFIITAACHVTTCYNTRH